MFPQVSKDWGKRGKGTSALNSGVNADEEGSRRSGEERKGT